MNVVSDEVFARMLGECSLGGATWLRPATPACRAAAIDAFAEMFRNEPEASATVILDKFEKMNQGLLIGSVLLVAATALITYGLTKK